MAFPKSLMQEDLQTYLELLKRVHPDPFARVEEAAYMKRFEKVRKTLPDFLDEAEFRRVFGTLAASLRDEHTSVPLPERPAPEGTPWSVLCEDRRVFLALGEGGEAPEAFGEIIRINGMDAWMFADSASQLFSGTDRAQQIQYLQEQFPEAAQLLCPKGEEPRLEWIRAGEQDIRTLLIGELGKERSEGASFEWKRVDKQTALMTFRAFEDPQRRFDAFLKELFQTLGQEDVHHLIIDLRRNQGGASHYGDRLLQYLLAQDFCQMSESRIQASAEAVQGLLGYVPAWLRWLPLTSIHPILKKLAKGPAGSQVSICFKPVRPLPPAKRFHGEVTLLIGPGTMSSASLFAATIQKYGRGKLVGAQTGGYATHFGNQLEFVLPGTGIRWLMPCSINLGNSQGPIHPEIYSVQNPEDFAQGIDTTLERTRKRIR